MSGEKEVKEYKLASIDRIWFEYDKQNDILYINFGLDVEDADEEFLTEDNIVVRIKNGRVVSLTVFEFSKRVNL
ncbi:MAG TPA: DUF2283 domain-containing protein [Pyrodictium sp.]|nr:DUF2283 domain-containing protein [Pyrodictium sp.]